MIELSEPLRIGMIGVGSVVSHFYMPAIIELNASHAGELGPVEIVAVADVVEANLAKMRDQFGVKNGYHSYHQMLEKHPELHAVIIATPNEHHVAPTVAAMAHGLHVLVEKPMARTVDECREMLHAAKASGKELVVGFQWRWHAESRFIRRQVEEGLLGEIKYVRVQTLRRRGIPNWGNFVQKANTGGGGLIDMGVHLCELALFLMGSHHSEPVSAVGSTWTYLGNRPDETENIWPNWNHKDYDVEDLAVGHVHFANGASMVVEASFAAHVKEPVHDVQIFGTRGGATWSRAEVYTDMNGYMMNLTPGYLRKTDIWHEKMRHFVEVCRGMRTNASSGEEGLAVQKILSGIYAAAGAGREVAL
jgi:predicted dehydrogenase